MALKLIGKCSCVVAIAIMALQVCSVNECFISNDLTRRAKESESKVGFFNFNGVFSVTITPQKKLAISFTYKYEQLEWDTWGDWETKKYVLKTGEHTSFEVSGKSGREDPDMGFPIVDINVEAVSEGNHVIKHSYNEENSTYEVYVTPEFYEEVRLKFGTTVFKAGRDYIEPNKEGSKLKVCYLRFIEVE
jgi:hypothetical protein